MFGRYVYFIPFYSFAKIPSVCLILSFRISYLCLCFNRTSAFYLQFSFISQNHFTILLEQRPSTACLHFLFLFLFVSNVSCIKYVVFIAKAVPVVHFFVRFLCFENQNQRCNNEKALGEQIPSSCVQDLFKIWKGIMFRTNGTTTPSSNAKQSHACFPLQAVIMCWSGETALTLLSLHLFASHFPTLCCFFFVVLVLHIFLFIHVPS